MASMSTQSMWRSREAQATCSGPQQAPQCAWGSKCLGFLYETLNLANIALGVSTTKTHSPKPAESKVHQGASLLILVRGETFVYRSAVTGKEAEGGTEVGQRREAERQGLSGSNAGPRMEVTESSDFQTYYFYYFVSYRRFCSKKL